VTDQTGAGGEVVERVYVEAAQDIARSCFVAFVLDTESGLPMLLASSEGGVAFEQRARMEAGIVQSCLVDGDGEAARDALAGFLDGLGIGGAGAVDLLMAARRAFVANDMLLLEINPLACTSAGDWVAIDAKVALDANALHRHPEFEALVADRVQSPTEREAQTRNINLVKLDGSIGVVVNGAGLGLATNDMLVDAGGRPANFMDIRTTATSFDVARGVELLLDDPAVRVILLNVHGGGMTVCDTVAEGVAFAYSRAKRRLPVVARLAGQNADWGLRILKDRKIPAEVFDTMTAAVRRAIEVAQGGRN
jgi:succinyl-CoA synthetase beta subunit